MQAINPNLEYTVIELLNVSKTDIPYYPVITGLMLVHAVCNKIGSYYQKPDITIDDQQCLVLVWKSENTDTPIGKVVLTIPPKDIYTKQLNLVIWHSSGKFESTTDVSIDRLAKAISGLT